jgi:hypothetical protein
MSKTCVAFVAAIGIAVAQMFAPAPASATDESFVMVYNGSDAYAWVTAYYTLFVSKQMGAWCVAPGEEDTHGLRSAIMEVRIEVSAGGCQRSPHLANRLMFFASSSMFEKAGTFRGLYKVKGQRRDPKSYDVDGPYKR